jgi:hypothetical protein
MNSSAHVFQHLHAAVYDLTGWALPDEGLRQLAAHLPAPLQREALPAGRATTFPSDVRQWCVRQQALVNAVVRRLQAHF